MKKIVVIGAGTWGTVVASLLADNSHIVKVYARNKEQIDKMNKTHIHDKLPEIVLNKNLIFVNDYVDAIKESDVVVYAIPSTAFRSVFNDTKKYLDKNKYLISLTKGMEDKTLFTMSEIIEDELKSSNIENNNIVVLSGPTHAEEVGKHFPTTIVSVSKNVEAAMYVQDLCMNERFRVYTNTDILGVEVCAAFKNIIALASGILVGLGFGDNIKAALLTRGLTEMIRVAEAIGCNKETLYGLAGIGDMIVTATSNHSRNFRCGKLIGEGINPIEAVKNVGMVVEGVNFLPKAIEIRDKYNLDLPISTGTYEIVINGKDPNQILNLLMTRSKKSE